MKVFNYSNNTWDYDFKLVKGIVHADDKYIEYGHFIVDYNCIPIYYRHKTLFALNPQCLHADLYYNNKYGCYTLDESNADNTIIESKYTFNYPIDRQYNFSKLSIPKQPVNIIPDFDFTKLSKFTFGLEFETSGGNIPWLYCLYNNLVPLYDGSIKGHEYVTFPLSSEELPIIKDHFSLLRTYTNFDKDCSLHIHFGGFPIVEEKLVNLVRFWSHFQFKLQEYIPQYSYYVQSYKSNGKAYNKPLKIADLKKFYEKYTGNDYEAENRFYRPNNFDEDELRKWEVHGRYYNLNIMHLLSGRDHKTVEFRFLRPTTNYSEIKWYILVFGAFLNYVININNKCYKKITVEKVVRFTYDKHLSDKIMEEGKKLIHLYKNCQNKDDLGGLDDRFKQKYFKLVNFNL